MCFLPADKGPCMQSSALWYYDSRNGACVQFIYGGCEGNPNRFETRQECENKCGEAQGDSFFFFVIVRYACIGLIVVNARV